MHQPVHQSSGHDPIPYELRSLGKFQIAGDNCASHLIPSGQNLKQQVGIFLIQCHIPKLQSVAGLSANAFLKRSPALPDR